MGRPGEIWRSLWSACLLAGCATGENGAPNADAELPPGVVELDPGSPPPVQGPPACDPSQCLVLQTLSPSGSPAAACCTESNECGLQFGATCRRVRFDVECARASLIRNALGCCRDDQFCGVLDAETGVCDYLPSVAQSIEVGRASLGRLSSLPVIRIDCDGYLSVRCGERECPYSLLGPGACCLPDGSCGLTPDGFGCYPSAIVDVDDCVSTAPSYLQCCSAEGFCGLLQNGQCGLTPSLTFQTCNTEFDCRQARQDGCCLDGVNCGTLDPVGGGCRERQGEPQPYEIIHLCDGQTLQRCDLGEWCSREECCLPGGICGAFDETWACTPL